jgi:hypothetical protein
VENQHASAASPDRAHSRRAFSSWFVLLIVQTFLVAEHKVNWHRRLGQATIGLAGLILVVKFVVSFESMARNIPPGDRRIGFAATNFLGVLISRSWFISPIANVPILPRISV